MRLGTVFLIVIFALFFFFPLGNLAVRAIAQLDGSGAAARGGILGVLQFTVLQAGLSSVLSILVALPGAYALSHFTFRFRRFFYSLSLVPFVLPSVIVVICIISFYGRSGVINRLFGTEFNLIYNFGGILIAHLFYNYAIALRIVGDGWYRISEGYGELARSLGDTRIRAFFRTTLPLLAPSIASAFVLIFVYCFMSFGIVLVFGGVRFMTLEVRIYQELYQRLNFARGSLFALVQLSISVLFLVLSGVVQKKQSARRTENRTLRLLKDEKPMTRFAVTAYWAAAAVFLFGPLCAMIIRSTAGASPFAAYTGLFGSGGSRDASGLIRSSVPAVIWRSILLAFLSGTAAFAVGFVAALSAGKARSREDTLVFSIVQIPLGMTVVGLAAGLRMAYGDFIPPVVLVLVGQFFLALPMVYRIARTVTRDLHPQLVAVAQNLGAGRFYAFRTVTLPVLKRGIINAYAFSIALAFADFTVVLVVGRGEIVTFPVAIFRLIGFRSFDYALALSGIYVFFCLLLFIVIDRTGSLRPGFSRRPRVLA